MLLSDFLVANNEELIGRCKAKVAARPPGDNISSPRLGNTVYGISAFLDQLRNTLRRRLELDSLDIGKTAAMHGAELLALGYTVDQVVHDYGDLCQSVTELAMEQHAPISTEDFRTLNLCLDNAIAGAVAEYGTQRDQVAFDEGVVGTTARLVVARRLANQLQSALLALHAIKRGNVGPSGATGALLLDSLLNMHPLIQSLLTDGRLPSDEPGDRT